MDFEFVSPDDKPALLGLTTPEWQAPARSVLGELDYKPQVAANHDDFFNRFNRTRCQLVLIEELLLRRPWRKTTPPVPPKPAMGHRSPRHRLLISEQFPRR